MKTVIFTLLSVLFTTVGFSQTILFQENFEGTTIGLTSSSVKNNNNWAISTALASQGSKCDTATVALGDTTYLTSTAFSCANMSFVQLEFDQIAKLQYGDGARIQVSADNGANWITLTTGQYLGNGYMDGSNQFTATSYATVWNPTNNNAVPTNSWWQHETFNISSIAADSSQVKIRFALLDANNNGSGGNYGWLLDSIKVTASFSELIPPTISLISPYPHDTVFGSGPYQVNAHVYDASGLDTVYLVYHTSTNVTDTLPMTMTAQDTFSAGIPFYGFGRSITYYVKAIDASPAHNMDSTSSQTFFCKYSTGGEYIIGNGTTSASSTSGNPFGQYYTGNKEQFLILASELTALGAGGGGLTSIAFDVTSTNSATSQGSNHDGFTIKVKNTSSSSLTNTFETGLTQVYSATNYQTILGWNSFSTTASFAWDGVSNILIETCFDNGASNWSSNAGIHVNSTSFNSVTYKYSDASSNECTQPSGTTMTTRPDIKLVFVSPGNLTNDIGVNQITNPTGGVTAGSPMPVNVTIKNFGVDTITYGKVKWKYDGVVQTPTYIFTDSLKADSVSSVITLATINPVAGAHNITAWTEDPDSLADFNFANDSSRVNFFACSSLLNGTYTINPNGSGATNYASFSDAVLALNQCGINGPVVFNVANGTYNEQIELPMINGSSATNTVTFQSASGDSSLVVMKYDAAGSSNNYVVQLDGTAYIKFKGIDFQANDSTYAKVFDLLNGVHDFTLENNIIESSVRALADNDDMNLICGLDSIGSNVLIKNNAIKNGSNAIKLLSFAAAINWKFQNNLIKGHYGKGIHLMGANSIEISGNEIYQDSIYSAPIYYGMYLEDNTGTPIIKMNKVLSKVSQLAFGIRMNDCSFSASNRGQIYNNFFNVHANSSSTTTTTGILVVNTPNLDIFYNNILITGAQTNSAALYLDGSSTDSTMVKNNILTNNAGGYAFYTVSVTNNKFTNNFNDLYTFGGTRFAKITTTVCADLAAFQTASADGANSVSYNPYYMSMVDLHIANNLMNGTGTPLSGFTTDIDGDVRNTSTPDIGADEFDPSPWDATVLEFMSPIGACGLDSIEAVTIKIKNVGSATINGNFTASYTWPGKASTVTENISTVITPGDTLIYTFNSTADLYMGNNGADSTFDFTAWVTLQGDPVHFNDSVHSSVESKYQPPAPVTQPTTVNYGASATLTATSNDSLTWWQYDTSTIALSYSNTYVTAPLWDTTTYYVSAGGAASADSLTTTFVSNNGSSGNVFSVTATNTLTIDSFYINGSSNSLMEVWYRQGSYIGHESSNAGWTLLGSHTVVSAGMNNPTRLPVGGLTIPAGQTYSLAVTYVSGSIRYTNGTGSNQTYQDANMTIDCGKGGGYWGFTISPRVWNGRIFYSLGSGGASCSSQKSPLQVNVVNFPSVDAGISSIANPSSSVVSGTQQDIKAVITNYGIGTMTSANIKWWINGMMQDSLAWVGSLTNGATDTVILDTAHVFNGGIYNITAWTSFPNNAFDSIQNNDTSGFTFNACMQGTYTIGDTSTGTFDFPSFTSAIAAIQSAGLCGNVVFNVDTGTYIEQLTIPSIFTSGPNATVTFQSATGDSTDVILKYSPTSYSSNFVVKLNGCDYFTFKNMTIKSGGGTYLGVVEIANGSEHNSFLNNVIETNVSTSSYARCFYSSGGNDHYTTIANNHIINGYYGVYLRGASSGSLEKGTVIKDNFIEGFYYYGVYTMYQDSVQILHNRIVDGSNSTYGYGMYIYYCDNETHIVGNVLDLNPSSYKYAMRIYYSDGTANKRGLIANNMISIGSGTGTNYGLYFYNSTFMDVVYNSVNITGGSTSSRAAYLYVYNSSADVNFVNNVLRDSTGYALYVQSSSGINMIDYNSYYTNGTNLAYWSGNKTTLSALQAASNKDVHSVNVDPQFFANNDLHLLTTQLSGMGTSIPVMNVDIDGEQRGSLATTIGADEVPLLPYDIGVSEILLVPDTTNEGQSTPIKVVVKNYGTDTINGFNISYSVNGGTAVVYNYNTAFPTGMIDTVLLTSFNSPAGNSSVCATTVLASDSNAFNDGTCKNFFGIPAKDAYMKSVYEITSYCGITYDTVKVMVTNVGIDSINASNQASPTTVHYRSNMGTIVNETFTPVVAPGDSAVYIFSTPVYVGANGAVDSIYDIIAWIDFVGDNVAYNDSASTQVKTYHVPTNPVVTSPVTVPYSSIATLSASSPTNDSIVWFTDSLLGTELFTGSSYTTPQNYKDTSYYAEARGGIPPAYRQIGNGTTANSTTGYPSPYGQFYTGDRVQYLIPASEIIAAGGSAGPITALAFDITTAAPATSTGANLTNFTIKIGSTNVSSLSSWISGLTQVYTTSSYVSTTGLNEHLFSTPYIWDGVSNVVIESCYDNYTGSSNYSYNAVCNYNNTSYTSVLDYHSDAGSVCGNASSTSYSKRPNLALKIGEVGCESQRVPVLVHVTGQLAADMGATKIVAPVSQINMTSTEDVTVRVRNFGTAAQSNIPVGYIMNGGSVVWDTITSSINPGDSLDFTFATKANMSAAGQTYNFKAFTALIVPMDSNQMNDTTLGSATNNLPNYCTCSASSTGYEDLIGCSVGTWSHTSPATGSMYTDYTSVSPVANIAPSVSYTVSISSDFPPGYSYAYTCYANMFIDFNRDGDFDDAGELVFGGTTNSSNTISGTMNVPANALAGLTRMRVVLRESGSQSNTGPCGTFTWGEAEDYTIMIMTPIANDAGVEAIVEPMDLNTNAVVPVLVKVRNYGTSSWSSVPVTYELNGGTPVTITDTTTVAPMDSVMVSLGNITLQSGANTLCVYTELLNDSNLFNDQQCSNPFLEATVSLSYLDDFESSNLWRKESGNSNQWQRGFPQMTHITTAHSPNNVWAIDLDSNYANNSDDKLYSPKILIPSIADSAYMKFWNFYDCQNGSDGGYIQYRINSGFWANMGYIGDPNGTNWVTSNNGGTHMWSGLNSGWVHSSYTMNFVNAVNPFYGANGDTVQFRFIFYSNGSSNSYDGWAIDDFEVSLPKIPQDGGVIAITSPDTSSQIGSQVTVTIKVKNFGSANLTSIPVAYDINGSGNWVNETFTPASPLAPDSVAAYTFTTGYTSPSAAYQICAKTLVTGDIYVQNDQLCKSVGVTVAPIDGGISQVTTAPYMPGIGVDTTKISWDNVVKAYIHNYGGTALSNFPVEYSLTGPWTIETFTGTIQPGDSALYSFTTTYKAPIGSYTLHVRTNVTGDADATNDQIDKPLFGLIDVGMGDNANDGFYVNQNEPNPANGVVRISYFIPNGGKVKFELRNTLGQVVISKESDEIDGLNSIEIDADKLSSGVYYYTVEYNKTRKTLKMVVSR